MANDRGAAPMAEGASGTTGISEMQLLEAFRSGDEASFRQVFNAHWVPVLRYAQALLDNRTQAQDIVQEIFCSLWNKRAQFTSLLHIKNFLYKSTRFACIDDLRRVQNRDRHMDQLLENALNEPMSDSLMMEEELYQAVISEIDALPEKYSEILRLKYLHGLDYAAIAERLGVPEATVRKQKQRALEMLKTAVLKKPLFCGISILMLLENF